MNIILAVKDKQLEKQIVSFAISKSFVSISMDKKKVTEIGQFLPRGRHSILWSFSNMDDILTLTEDKHEQYKLIYVNLENEKSPQEAALAKRADLHLPNFNEPARQQMAAFFREGMSNFARPSWDAYFMEIAHVIARRGNCMKRQVAAVIIRDKQIISTGYNGTPRGAKNCNDGGCKRCNDLASAGTDLGDCWCCHAEENAITQAAYHGTPIKDATLYCTHSPCLHCAKLIVNSGIIEVVYSDDYPMAARTLDLFNECHVRCRQFSTGNATIE